MIALGNIYLIPSSLSDDAKDHISSAIREIVNRISYFIVENEKSARRFLKSIGYTKSFDEIILQKLECDEDFVSNQELSKHLESGEHVGVITEAGAPGIADPGAAVVKWAHEHKVKVVPLAGSSSIFLALMASGLNGQYFAFQGYLPVHSVERKRKLKELEEESRRKNQTQIFIETPYRNDSLLKDILEACKTTTNLCIACDLTAKTEFILTQTIGDWRKKNYAFNKRPCIFLLLA